MCTWSGVFKLVVAAVAVTSLAGCSQISGLKARKAFKEANEFYKEADYKKAAEAYEAVIAANPDEVRAYFFLANSYDNLYNPDKADDAANRALMEKAVNLYQLSADKLANGTSEEEKTLHKRSFEYLAAAYGSDKLNDPSKAEPILQKMIQMEPGEPTNYFRLAILYKDAGAYEEAEKMYLNAKEAKPNDPSVYTTLAAYYNERGDFDKTIQALEERAAKEPTNPAAYHMIASYYWDETRNDPKLRDNQKREYIQKGLEAVDKALKLKPDYVEAVVFKGLLLRLQAIIEPARQKELLNEAIKLSEKANELQKKQTAGAPPAGQ